MNEPYRICSRCVMDSSARQIAFNRDGVCSYCRAFEKRIAKTIGSSPEQKRIHLESLLSRVKSDGTGKKYDCIVGVSGGVDSSWVLVKAVEMGLRPLAVHMDNGWNSELAQNNIANLIDSLGVDLYTYVIDWQEYKSLMQSFLDADVLDIELLYDNAMLAVCYRLARKHHLHYILSGSNTATEGMVIPASWTWYKLDVKSIKSIAKRFGKVKIRTFPTFNTIDFVFNTFVRKIRWVPFLDFFDYNKEVTLRELETHFGYKRYPYKHYESIFTRFYQGFILPKKFGVDKRRVHLSTLVMTHQLTREEALMDLERIPYPTQTEMDQDVAYFKKKMQWSDEDLDLYLKRPERQHTEFGSEVSLGEKLKMLRSWLTKQPIESQVARGDE